MRELLGLRTGAADAVAASVALDPTFALGHTALALLGALLPLALPSPVRQPLGPARALSALAPYARSHRNAIFREVVEPLARALVPMAAARSSQAADLLGALGRPTVRLGGSDAQRELVEEVRICALLRAERHDEAGALLEARLDRRHSSRDARWRATCGPTPR